MTYLWEMGPPDADDLWWNMERFIDAAAVCPEPNWPVGLHRLAQAYRQLEAQVEDMERSSARYRAAYPGVMT